MKPSFISTVKGLVRVTNQWLTRTPERALQEAYEAALKIKGLEDDYFGGGKISTDYGSYSKTAHAYFQGELRKYLNIAKIRLAEFKASNTVLRLSNRTITEVQVDDENADQYAISIINKPKLLLKKLEFIDEVLARYLTRSTSDAVIVVQNSAPSSQNGKNGDRPVPGRSSTRALAETDDLVKRTKQSLQEDFESLADKTGVLPRSILRTVDRVKRELDPKAEEEVVQNFRTSKARTVISIRLILLLIILPLLTQQLAKNFLVGPIVDQMRAGEQVKVFLNVDMEEEALVELQRFEERLRFEQLIHQAPPLSPEEMEQQLEDKAEELRNRFYQESNNAVKNVFSDMFSVGVFALILLNSRREIEILKSFIDELVYGLSDSAKAFIIILFTDVFVGFHSPHGWEVLLEGVAQHFGLAANREFIFLFIATFPVILDTIFKYWIFRYLNRISPSAVATYRTMNE